MARQILPIAGAVIGGYFGGAQGAQWGFAIGSLIGNVVDPVEIQGNKLGDAPVQTASEGGARAVVFGKGCIRALCVLERGGRRVVKDRQSGGKGGPVTVTERALWTFAIGLGEALPGGIVLRIWQDERLVYDIRNDSAIPRDSLEYGKRFRFYDGSEDQLPDPALEALYGAGNAPYYRGTAYLVFPEFDLTDTGERVPTFRVEVAASGSVAQANAVMAFGYSGSGNTSARIGYSPDGLDWSQPVLSAEGTGRPYLASMGGRFISWGNNNAAYSDDRGVTWVPSVGSLGGSGGIRAGAVSGNRILIAGGANQIRRSVDFGETFQPWEGSPSVNHVAIGDYYVAGLHGAFGNVYRYSDEWEGPYDSGITATSTRKALSTDGQMFRVAGKDDDGPAIKRSYTLDGWLSDSLPPDIGTEITAIAVGRIGTDSIWLAGTDTGKVLRAVNDGGFGLAYDEFGYSVEDIVFNGQFFLLAGGNSSGPGSGKIAASADGLLLVDLPNNFGKWVRSLASVPQAAPTAVGEPVPLSTILEWAHQRAGHTADDYDVSEATDMLDGVVFEQSVSGAETINSVIGAFFFDPADYDGKIRYVRRGKAAVRTLTSSDLIEEPESAKRGNAIEYPRKVHFFFGSATNAYAVTKATSARYSADNLAVGEASVSCPVTFDDPVVPNEISAKLHKVMWAEAGGELEWHISDEHLDLVPSDVVHLDYLGRQWRARIIQIQHDPGQMKLTMRVDRQSAYTANVPVVPIPPPPTPPQPAIPSETILAVMDIPALTDNGDTLGPYVGMTGADDAWSGAVLQQSLDGGASFGTVASTSLNAVMGVLVDPVADASEHYTDTTNVVVVELFTEDELESRTTAALLNQGGAFALSWDDGGVQRWELMQFRDAELIGERTYKLSYLTRGRKATTTAAHESGATFVLLDGAILRLSAQSAWVGTTLMHRAVSNGLSPESADVVQTQFEGNSQREWPVASLTLALVGDDLTATVIPRHRFGSTMNPIRSLNWSGYRWVVTDGVSTINRDGTSDAEVFDVSAFTGTISVTVSQINRLTGPGDAVTEDISA